MKKTIRTVIIVIVFAAIILGYYYYLSHRNVSNQDKVEKETDIEMIINTNLNLDYPKTPREVIKLYNKMLKCYYNDNPSEVEIKDLVLQQRELLDDELKENNPEAQMVQNTRNDISNAKDNGRTIVSSTVCSSNEIVYKTIDDRECAYVTSGYFIKNKDGYEKTTQKYVLRKDENGKWKIIVYYLC